MISNKPPIEAFVWIWLPNSFESVVAGRLHASNGRIHFNYGKSYLQRVREANSAIAIYEGELPLKSGVLPLLNGLNMPNCIRDAAPDAWGRRVIINKLMPGSIRADLQIDTAQIDELSYLLESGSDRIGALDFQKSATHYVPRESNNVSLDELLSSSQRVEQGIPLTTQLDHALLHGSSIGGARPKALIDTADKKYIAKFSSSTDLFNLLKAEFVAMRLAKVVGLDVAEVKLTRALNKDVLLIERFDRVSNNFRWQRKAMVSALTLLGLDEMMARYASYESLADIIRLKFVAPQKTLKELFSRMVFNILSGNNDDHARNHSAFWDGKHLSLTPAYDICPQARSSTICSQAMLINGSNNLSKLTNCLNVADKFHLGLNEAREIITNQVKTIENYWDKVCDEAQLSTVDRNFLWHRQFLNPFAFEGFGK
jgi:serine/threonine-protein kinase HipA